ncbi:MAG: acyl carrier protein [Vicinamibacterales bacterium]
MNEAEAAAAEIQRFLITELARRIEVDPDTIDPRQPFERYGLDSLNALRLAVELEARIGRHIPTTALWDYPSIESLAKYLAVELNVREILPVRV